MLPRVANCLDCGTPITATSKTGCCIKCGNRRRWADPEFRAKRIAGIHRKWRDDPLWAARKKASLTAAVLAAQQANPEKWRQLGFAHIGNLTSPEAKAKQIAAVKAAGWKATERHLGWCPEEYRNDYRHLVNWKHIKAAEAKQIIIAQIKADEAKLSPFERQQRALERGGRIVANDASPSLANPADYGERKWA